RFADNLPIVALAFRPDGRQLVCGAGFFPGDGRASNYPQPAKDARGLHVIALSPLPDAAVPGPGHVHDIRFSPDGKQYLVLAQGVSVHDAATRRRLWHAPAVGAGYRPDGKSILVMGKTKVEERDAATGKVLKEHPQPKTKWARKL